MVGLAGMGDENRQTPRHAEGESVQNAAARSARGTHNASSRVADPQSRAAGSGAKAALSGKQRHLERCCAAAKRGAGDSSSPRLTAWARASPGKLAIRAVARIKLKLQRIAFSIAAKSANVTANRANKVAHNNCWQKIEAELLPPCPRP